METGKRHGPVAGKVEPFVPRREHSPRELRSWAKRTGFVSDYSGEAGTSASEKLDPKGGDGGGGSSPKIEIDPVLGRTTLHRANGNEIEPVSWSTHGATTSENDRDGNGTVGRENRRGRNGNEPVLALAPNGEKKVGFRGTGNANGVVNRDSNGNGNGHGISAVAPVPEQKEEEKEEDAAGGDVKVNLYTEGEVPADGGWQGPSGLKCGLTENPGFAPLLYYGLQHYLSLAGSLVLIPLVMVPAMGGTDKDTANVISTMLFLSGITTILHSYFGTRLPLVQESSFVYMAPA